MPDAALRDATAALRNGRAPLRTARITGLGHYVPERVVPNADIAERIGVDDEWIARRTGIRSRRWAADGETLADMAVAAGTRALEDAGIDAGAIDVGAACTGWLAGLRLAAGQVESGRADHVLLIGADRLSSLLNLDDQATASLFGDGAGAVVVSAADADTGEGPGRAGGIGPIVLASDGSLGDRITAGYGADRALKMDGHSTYQVAVKRLTECTVEACERAGVELDDIDLFVYHQANGRIIRAVGQRLELPEEKVADYVAGMANTSAASIPLALGLLRQDGRLRIGQRVLVAAIGGGFTWGAGVVEWGIG
jgi:3-oxoacyl-[acyl-carrier-protein] synthase-3